MSRTFYHKLSKVFEQQIPNQGSPDEIYFDALKRNDPITAQKVLNSLKGIQVVSSDIDRGQGVHSPSDPESGAPGWDLTGNGIYPQDVYTMGVRHYGTGENAMDHTAFGLVLKMKGHPNQMIRIYRAVEKDGPKKILPGDWVTIIRQYAQEHGKGNIHGGYKLLSALVSARDIFTSGDSWLEWGYHPQPKMYPRLIVKDEEGNIVPPSKRFS